MEAFFVDCMDAFIWCDGEGHGFLPEGYMTVFYQGDVSFCIFGSGHGGACFFDAEAIMDTLR